MINLLKILAAIAVVLTIAACDDDDMPQILGSECVNNCVGIAECNSGYCECPEGFPEIASGFCVQDTTGAAFITYDQYPGLLDTTVIHFSVDPYKEWKVGDKLTEHLNGTTYNRDPYAVSIFQVPLGSSYYPGTVGATTDSIVILPVYSKNSFHDVYWQDEWVCSLTYFTGNFVDENTIVGEIRLLWCDSNGSTEMPANLENGAAGLYPVTYTRIQ